MCTRMSQSMPQLSAMFQRPPGEVETCDGVLEGKGEMGGGGSRSRPGSGDAAVRIPTKCKRVWRNTKRCGGIRGEALEARSDNSLCEVLAVLIRQRLP
jgi:hypothetical protein